MPTAIELIIITFLLEPICNDCITRNAEKTTPSAVKVKSVDSQTSYLMNGSDVSDDNSGTSSNRAMTTTAVDRTCPMCGKCYKKSEDFEIFQRHVEYHFIDDNELDLSIDKNYDMISHTAPNF